MKDSFCVCNKNTCFSTKIKPFLMKRCSKVFNVLHLCYVKDRNLLNPRGKNGIFGKNEILKSS